MLFEECDAMCCLFSGVRLPHLDYTLKILNRNLTLDPKISQPSAPETLNTAQASARQRESKPSPPRSQCTGMVGRGLARSRLLPRLADCHKRQGLQGLGLGCLSIGVQAWGFGGVGGGVGRQ